MIIKYGIVFKLKDNNGKLDSFFLLLETIKQTLENMGFQNGSFNVNIAHAFGQVPLKFNSVEDRNLFLLLFKNPFIGSTAKLDIEAIEPEKEWY